MRLGFFTSITFLHLGLLAGACCAAQPNDIEHLGRGVIALYRDSSGTIVWRSEPTIVLALNGDESPDPRLNVSDGTYRWLGQLYVLRPGKHRFSGMVRGKLAFTIDGKELVRASVEGQQPASFQSQDIELTAGVHRLQADFTRLPGPARLELFWQAQHFYREPVPFEALFHLPGDAAGEIAANQVFDRGRFLMEEFNCARCHEPQTEDRLAKGLAYRQGPDLSRAGARLYAGWIYRWLEAPEKVHSWATMPRLFPDDELGHVERFAVASYLSSLGGPLRPDPPRGDPQNRAESIARGERLFVAVGCAACHGEINAPARDSVDHRIYPLNEPGRKTTVSQLARYLEDPLKVAPSGRMPNMLLRRDEARDLARYLCKAGATTSDLSLPAPPAQEKIDAAWKRLSALTPGLFPRGEGRKADAQLLELGKRLVSEKRCNACHTIEPDGKPFRRREAPWFDRIREAEAKIPGCLSLSASPSNPVFPISETDRNAIRFFLREGKGAGSRAPAYEARTALESFNCLACHSRNGQGGLAIKLVEQLQKIQVAENAEAVSPPPLTDVGHKLRLSWMQQVLTSAGRARPWMGLRMPQFGQSNVGRLPALLASADGAEQGNKPAQVRLTADKITAGKRLVGKTGFGCISCHDIAGIANAGTRGPDLAFMESRVNYNWYRRWLEQPQRMQPGTRMPTVFPEGNSLLTDVLGGKVDSQAEAMWSYLSLGKQLPLPEGLEPPKGLILTARDRPILLRTFLQDAGTQAVAVGFPGGISFAFDSTMCRLAYGWSGGFLDASPVWNDRGGNPATLLGARFWTSPPGFPWVLGRSSAPPDFEHQSKDPAYGASLPEGELFKGDRHLKFRGYTMGKDGVPSFQYRVESDSHRWADFSERVEPLRTPIAAGVSRHFVVKGSAGTNAWFLAAESADRPKVLKDVLLATQPGGKAMVMEIKGIPTGVEWKLHQSHGKWEVLIHLGDQEVQGGAEAIVNLWVLPRNDPALIDEFVRTK
jgi:mono/diheme cytochrome c family protein